MYLERGGIEWVRLNKVSFIYFS